MLKLYILRFLFDSQKQQVSRYEASDSKSKILGHNWFGSCGNPLIFIDQQISLNILFIYFEISSNVTIKLQSI